MNIKNLLRFLLHSVTATILVTLSTSTLATQLEQDVKNLVHQFKTSSTVMRKKNTTNKKFRPKRKLVVTATAYNSLRGQTDSTPNIAAWGDRLHPNMKVIAVSRDLLHKYGMKRGTPVKIRGLDGIYIVLDKMSRRWRKTIDIYMGKSRRKARHWGRKRVEIQW